MTPRPEATRLHTSGIDFAINVWKSALAPTTGNARITTFAVQAPLLQPHGKPQPPPQMPLANHVAQGQLRAPPSGPRNKLPCASLACKHTVFRQAWQCWGKDATLCETRPGGHMRAEIAQRPPTATIAKGTPTVPHGEHAGHGNEDHALPSEGLIEY